MNILQAILAIPISILGFLVGANFLNSSRETKKVEQISFGSVICRNISENFYTHTVCEFKTKQNSRFCVLDKETNAQTTIDCKIFDDLGE